MRSVAVVFVLLDLVLLASVVFDAKQINRLITLQKYRVDRLLRCNCQLVGCLLRHQIQLVIDLEPLVGNGSL